MKIKISNGRVINPKTQFDSIADVYIAAGKIVGIGTMPAGFQANRVIDATNQIVCPGLVDLAARLREPGFEYRATLESEMNAACAGGVTSLACPPDTDPPLDEPGLVEMLKFRAKNLNQVRVYPIGALTQKLEGLRLTEMAELRDAGCVGFSQADAPISDTQVLVRALEYASTFGFTVWLRPEDAYLAKGGVAHDGFVATRLGLPAIPVSAETVAIATILLLVRETNARVHLCRLSSAQGIDMVRRAKAEGLNISCDVSINHLHLSEMDIGYFDPNYHLSPPLRSTRDREAIREGLADGTIDALCSNHTPVDDDAKQMPFAEAEAGATGLELLLPLALKWAQDQGVGLTNALGRITHHPAQILGLDVGHLSVGQVADVCVFNPESRWQVIPANLRSQGKNTPFLGYEMQGAVTFTLVDGQVVFEAKK